MTSEEIITELNKYLISDTGYELFAVAAPGLRLDYLITFDISNDKHENFFAPYFEVSNLSDAKEIIKAVLEKENGGTIPDFIDRFNKILSGKEIDWKEKTYVSVYRPARLDT